MATISILNPTINKCIYCSGKGETDEHIIPFALGGKAKLNKASCERCRDITSRCELNPLKENWAEARAALDYPSRNRNFNDEVFSLKVILKDGTEGILNLRKNEILGLTSFLEYPPPAFLVPSNYKSGIVINAHTLISFGPDVKALVNKYNIKEIKYSVKYKGSSFERMIVKIAYCATVASLGLDNFDTHVLQTILGAKDDVSFWMGCDPEAKIMPLIGKVQANNAVKIGIYQKNGTSCVIVRLKFFAASDAPEYIVVIGTLKSDFVMAENNILLF